MPSGAHRGGAVRTALVRLSESRPPPHPAPKLPAETSVPYALAPDEQSDQALAWVFGDRRVEAAAAESGWLLHPQGPQPVALRDPPELVVGLSQGDAMVYLERPMALPPGADRPLWLSWPLELRIMGGTGQPLETFRLGLRHAMLGSVDGGRVVPAARCVGLSEARSAPSRTHAALRARLVNRSAELLVLRRFPISEVDLPLFHDAGQFAAGMVEVRIDDASRAHARTVPMSPPPGFQLVPAEVANGQRQPTRGLDWLLDATRRSTEFQL